MWKDEDGNYLFFGNILTCVSNSFSHTQLRAQIMALREPTEKKEKANGDRQEDKNNDDSGSYTATSDGEEIEEDTKLSLADFNGPKLLTFDGDQTLYSDGTNFESNPRLANYLYKLIKHGVNIAVVTAAGYEYNIEKYEYRLSGLLNYFKNKGLSKEECDRFYLFGGECNYLMKVNKL